MIGFPFDSIVTFDEQGNPTYDRGVSSKPLKELIHKLYTTGVMLKPDDNLQVYAGAEGMTVVVHPGFCVIEGGLKLEEHNRTLQLQAADTTYDRIDTVVMRWDGNDNVRVCDLYVIEGTPASSPVRPTLTREGSIYEIGLADVLVPHGSTSVTQARITDTRYDSDRCGVVTGPGSEEYLQDEIDDINNLIGDGTLATTAQQIIAAINEVNTKASQGSNVTITPALQSGTKIADFSINNVPGVLYAPEGGGEVVFSEYYSSTSIHTVCSAVREVFRGKSFNKIASAIIAIGSSESDPEFYRLAKGYSISGAIPYSLKFVSEYTLSPTAIGTMILTISNDSNSSGWIYNQVRGLDGNALIGGSGNYTENGMNASKQFTGYVKVIM